MPEFVRSVRRPLALLVVTVAFLFGCGDGPTPAAGEHGATVTVERSRFAPQELRVAAGTTVSFTNSDPFAHTVTAMDADDLRFDSGELAEGEVFRQRFARPGTYRYFCEIHPTMRAVVVVE